MTVAPLAPPTDPSLAATPGLGAPGHAAPGQEQILTGEAVHLNVRTAGLGSRVLARLVDLVVQFVLLNVLSLVAVLALVLLAGIGLVQLDDASYTVVLILCSLATLIGYPVTLETLTRGRTPGKAMFGLRAVRTDGGPVTFRHSLVRTLVGVAVEFPGIIPPIIWLAPIATMIASPQGRRVGDYVAGTMVIHERTPAAWGWAPSMPMHLAAWAATLDLTAVDDDLALAVRSFLARNRTLREPARSVLGERLVREVAALTNPPPPPGTPAWMYLAAVHAERHRRAMGNLAAVRQRAATVWPDLAAATAPPVWTPPPAPRKARRQRNSAAPQ